MDTTYARLVILTGQEARLDDRPVTAADGQTVYDAAFMACAEVARELGEPVLVHGTDRVQAQDSWFTVDQDGAAEVADPPPGLQVDDDVEEHGHTPAGPESAEVAADDETAGEQRQGTSGRGATGESLFEEAQDEPVAGQDGESPRRGRRQASPVVAESFVLPPKDRPVRGLRAFVYQASGGLINMGPSAAEVEEEELAQRVARHVPGCHNTAVLSLKGGIGKTSTTVGIGLMLAEHRGDIPCAVDANPDSGDLAERALGEGLYRSGVPLTISDVLRDLDGITSLTALSRYMHQAGRLHVLAGEQDPEISDSLTADEWLRIHAELSKYYSVMLTDCGTGVTHNAMKGILQTADNIVVAAGYAVSGAKRARNTLLWLMDHGYGDLARNATVVVTDKDDVSGRVNKAAIKESLNGLCRQLISVPHDSAVADGDRIVMENLRPETRRAYLEIAAAVVDGYE